MLKSSMIQPNHNLYGSIEGERAHHLTFKQVLRNCLLATTAAAIAFTASCQVATTIDPKAQIKADLDRGVSVLPFSPDAYCTGSRTIADPLGHQFEIPLQCGPTLTSDVTKIDFFPPGTVNYGMIQGVTALKGDPFSGDEIVVFTSQELYIDPAIAQTVDSCKEKIIVDKEAWLNSGIQAFLWKIGFNRLFLRVNAKDGENAVKNLKVIFDIAAINESLGPQQEVASCFAGDKDMIRQLFVAKNSVTIAGLTQDGVITSGELVNFIDSIMLFARTDPTFKNEMGNLRAYLSNN